MTVCTSGFWGSMMRTCSGAGVPTCSDRYSGYWNGKISSIPHLISVNSSVSHIKCPNRVEIGDRTGNQTYYIETTGDSPSIPRSTQRREPCLTSGSLARESPPSCLRPRPPGFAVPTQLGQTAAGTLGGLSRLCRGWCGGAILIWDRPRQKTFPWSPVLIFYLNSGAFEKTL